MKKFLFAMVVVGMTACGPDAAGLSGTSDSDSDELAITDGALTSTSAQATWFPIGEGNTWNFESASGTRTIKLTSVSSTMAKLEGLYANPVWVGLSSSSASTLFAWSDSRNAWVPFIRFGYSTTSWTYGEGACQTQRLKRAATGTTVTSRGGNFTDTRVIGSELVTQPNVMCAAPAFNELTFAADTGLVSFRTGRGERFTLVSATVNGKRFPGSNGSVAATQKLDQASYTNVPNTLRCVTTPCPSNAVTAHADLTFTVTNNTRSTFTWKFPNGCQFDVEVASATGTVVKRLSDGRSCTQGLTQLTLAPGASKVFTGELKLEDKTGLQLDGEFTTTARLTGTGGPATSASSSFAVTIRR